MTEIIVKEIADGQSQKNRQKIGENRCNEKYVSLKELEVKMEMAKRWNGVLPVNVYASAPLPILDILNK